MDRGPPAAVSSPRPATPRSAPNPPPKNNPGRVRGFPVEESKNSSTNLPRLLSASTAGFLQAAVNILVLRVLNGMATSVVTGTLPASRLPICVVTRSDLRFRLVQLGEGARIEETAAHSEPVLTLTADISRERAGNPRQNAPHPFQAWDVIRLPDFFASALHKRAVNHGTGRIFRVGDRDADLLVLLQRQRLQGPKDPIFIHGVNLTVHRIAILRRKYNAANERRRARHGRQRNVVSLFASSVNRSDVDGLFPGRIRKPTPRKTKQAKRYRNDARRFAHGGDCSDVNLLLRQPEASKRFHNAACLIRTVYLKQALPAIACQWTNSAIRMTMGMGMPSIKSKIERMVSLLNIQFEIEKRPKLGSIATVTRLQSPTAKRLQHDLVACPRWLRRNSRKTRRSKEQGMPTTKNAPPLCGRCLRLVEPSQKHRTPVCRHRLG